MENEKKCKCISEIEEKILAQQQEKFNDDESISDIDVSLEVGISTSGNKMFVNTSTKASVSYLKKGKWKKSIVYISHQFCPFCGEKKQ